MSARRPLAPSSSCVLALALALTPLAVACAGPSPMPPRTVSLRMIGSPKQAIVVIDDQLVGELDFVAAHGVALPPGVHHITVKAPGYFPWDKEVDAKLGENEKPTLVRFEVKLVPIPD